MIENIKQYIAENQIDYAFDLLEKYTQNDRPRVKNEVILYKNRYNSLTSEKRKGIISEKEFGAEYNKLIDDMLSFLKEKTSIPEKKSSNKEILLIILVMIREQAEELLLSKEHNNNVWEFCKLSQLSGVKDVIERYGVNFRDEWHPFGDKDGAIRDIVEQFEKDIIKVKPLKFKSYTDFFFNGHKKQVFEDLKTNECLFIIDAISMFHPDIYKKFIRRTSGIDEKQLSLFVISPVNMRKHCLNNLFEEIIDDSIGYFFTTHDEYLSPHRGFGIGSEIDLRRNMKISLVEKFQLDKYIIEQWESVLELGGYEKKEKEDIVYYT